MIFGKGSGVLKIEIPHLAATPKVCTAIYTPTGLHKTRRRTALVEACCEEKIHARLNHAGAH